MTTTRQTEIYDLAAIDTTTPPLVAYSELTDLPSRLTEADYLSYYNQHIDQLPLPHLNDCPANRIRIARHYITSACSLLADEALEALVGSW